MTIKVDFTPQFIKELQRLNRKYPQITDEVERLVDDLEQGQHPGDKIPQVGYDVYKVRLRNRSAGRGKQGGFRALYYVRTAHFVILLSIYSKSQQSDISADRIRSIIDDYVSTHDDE